VKTANGDKNAPISLRGFLDETLRFRDNRESLPDLEPDEETKKRSMP